MGPIMNLALLILFRGEFTVNEGQFSEAAGMMLVYDIIKVMPDVFKELVFRGVHVIRDEDVPELLKLSKEHVYEMRLENDENQFLQI